LAIEKEKMTNLLRVFAPVLLAPLISWLLFACVFNIVRVDGASMEPTLRHGNLLLCSRLFKGSPERGDVVVVERMDKNIIKRVVAVEGDSIDIDFQTGDVFLNGEALDEPYILNKTFRQGGWDLPLTVPAGCVFILGDNREGSLDSRYFGPISVKDILCKELFRFA
jgi:signal peptidase I